MLSLFKHAFVFDSLFQEDVSLTKNLHVFNSAEMSFVYFSHALVYSGNVAKLFCVIRMHAKSVL